MFWTRLASGVVLVIIMLVAFLTGGTVLAGLLFVISLIAFMELAKATGIHTRGKRINAFETAGLLGVSAYYGAVYFSGSHTLLLMAVIGVFMADMFIYVVMFPKYRSEQVMAAFFAFMYAPVMLSFMYQTRTLHYGNYIVWLILISSWGCDTCAYVVGMLIGKKKIFPVLSPKKSLEGCIGGVAGAALIGALYGHYIVDQVVADQAVTWVIAFICGVGAVMSQVGDLAASAVKRNHDIKDYGKLIPGHGGIMDRFDSVIVTAPMIYFLTALLIKSV